MRDRARARPFRPFLLLACSTLFLAGPLRAASTLMWLPDWYQGNLDSVNITSVTIPHYGDTGTAANGYYYGSKDLALTRSKAWTRPIRVNLHVDTTGMAAGLKLPSELSRWWYAQTNYDPGDFRENRFQVDLKFQSFSHSLSWNKQSISVGSGTGSGTTGAEFNRDQDTKLGLINQCESDYPNDTLWIYNPATSSVFNPDYNASADTVINQGYVGNGTLVCSDHNPFNVKVGTVHVYNPWPGKSLWVQQGGIWRPLYAETGRPGWQTATIWAEPTADTAFKVRIASMKPAAVAPGIEYLDASGFNTVATGPAFDFTASPGSEQWIMPPVVEGSASKVATTEPPLVTVLMVQRPDWNASAMRILWKGFSARFIAGSTRYCDWFSLPLYEGIVPEAITLQHPSADSLFGTTGKVATPADLSTYTGWIALGSAVTDDTTWVTTRPLVARITSRPDVSQATACDTKVLAFSAYDYAQDVTSSSSYFYAPFAEANSGVVFPSGSKAGQTTDNCGHTKGLVGKTLNSDGFPVWTGTVNCDIGEEAHGPQHWYDTLWRSTDGGTSNTTSSGATQVNAFKCVPVTLTLDSDDGYYKFSNSNYFPLDQATSVPYGPTTGNNFHFAMHAKATFEYVQGLEFKFTGDDDVWIFIDKKLALDLGGQHNPVTASLDLDKLGLTEGQSYQFDMFYSERHTLGSNMAIQTTMNLVPTLNVEFDSSGSSGGVQDFVVKVIETQSTDPSVCPEENPTPPEPTITLVRASVYLTAPDQSTEEVVDSLKYAAAGLVISGNYSHIAVDTLKLQQSGLFTQRGTWTVVLAYGSETWSIPFTIITKNVDASGTLFDRDGDGRGDSVAVHGDGESGAFKGSYEAVFVWADAAGIPDSVLAPAESLVVVAGDSALAATFAPLPLRTSCPPDGCTGSMGRIWALDEGDTVKNRLVELQDGIAPVADSAWLVYDTTGTGKDTLWVRATESLLRNTGTMPDTTAGWTLLGESAQPRLLEADGTVSGNVLAIPLDPGSNPVQLGDSLRLGSLAADPAGNAPGAASRWVPIAMKPRLRAWMLDVDGDGMPDSVAFAGKSPLADVVSARIGWQTADGVDTILAVALPDGPGTGIRLPATTLRNATACANCAIELADADGGTATIALYDSVPPVPVRATLITSGDGAPDTLEVVLSEGVRLGSGDLVRFAADSAGTASALPDGSAGTPVLSDRTLRIVVDSGSIPTSWDWLRLAQGTADSGGAAVGVSSAWVPLKIRPSGSASLFDRDGDGRADSVRFTVRGSIASLGATEAVLSWRDVDGRTITRTWSLDGNASGSFGLHPVDSALWFPFAATSCPGSTCTIALGDVTWPLLDKVPPVVLGGFYAFGSGAAPDTLRAGLSEPLSQRSGYPAWLQFGGDGGLLGDVDHDSAAIAISGDSVFLRIPQVRGPGANTEFVRTAVAGNLLDDQSNGPDISSPWARLDFGAPPVSVAVKDPSGQGRPDLLDLATLRTVPVAALSIDTLVLDWTDSAGTGLARRGVSFAGVAADTASQAWSIALDPALALGATGCTLAGCGASVANARSSLPALLLDSAAPVALRARLGYSLPEVARDTLEVVLSEVWPTSETSTDLDSALVQAGPGTPRELVPYLGWFLRADGRTLAVVLDTARSNRIAADDSAWLAPRIADSTGNHPAENTRRVPLSLGLRPLQMRVSTLPGVRRNAGETAWPLPGKGTPSFEVLVRPAGDGNPWQRLAGSALGEGPANDTANLVGILVTVNRPFSGMVYVYDNQGVALAEVDLSGLSEALAAEGSTFDRKREIWIAWNGTDGAGQFAASGVYLMRLVARVQMDENLGSEPRNFVRRIGWHQK